MPTKHSHVCRYGPTNIYNVSSPIGDIHVTSCPKGLHSVSQSAEINDDNFYPNRSVSVEITRKCWDDNGYVYKPAVYCAEWLKIFFKDPYRTISMEVPSLCPGIVGSQSGSFRERAWLVLAERVKVGSTISYGELAKLAGSPRAAQAVGTAMKTNPFQIIVPCHRVICTSGRIGLYAGGTRNKVKEWLLDHERSKDR